MSFLELLSIIVGVIAIILGIVSILVSLEAKSSSTRSRKEAVEYNERTKDLLHEIDKRSTVMEEKVSENFQKLLDMQNELISKTMIPQKQPMEEQLALSFLNKLMESPQGVEQLTKFLEKHMPEDNK